MKNLLLKTAIAAVLAGPAMAQAASLDDIQKEIAEMKAKNERLEAEVSALKEKSKAQSKDAPADSANAKPVPHVTQNGSGKFALESADGLTSISLTGRLHFDTGAYVSFKPDNATVGPQFLSDGVNARRARIGVSGKVAGGWTFGFIYDGGNSQDGTGTGGNPAGIQTAQISYTGFKGVIIDLPGYSEPPYPLDVAVSSNDIMFMERATPANVAAGFGAGDFRSNAGVRFYGDRYWIGAYLTGPAYGDSHTLVRERLGSFQRATAQVLTGDNYSLHLGVNAFELLQTPDTGPGTARTVTLSDRPELRIDPTALLSTGGLGSATNPVSSAKVYGFEAAGGWNSIYGQGEYFKYDVSRRGLGSNSFDGYYGQVSWTITGEHRKYSPTTGAYSGITPNKPFGVHGGWGALELAARYSKTNLNDDFVEGVALSAQPTAVNGGEMKNITLGANWYLNGYLRFMLNYVHSELDRVNGTATATAPLGAPIGYKMDAFALRTQLSW